MKIFIPREMRKKLIKLAELLPVPTHIIRKGELVEAPNERNHTRLLIKAYKWNGRAGVEAYVEAFQEEWNHIRMMQQFTEFNKNNN